MQMQTEREDGTNASADMLAAALAAARVGRGGDGAGGAISTHRGVRLHGVNLDAVRDGAEMLDDLRIEHHLSIASLRAHA